MSVEPRHVKTCLKIFVVVITKGALAGGVPPIMTLSVLYQKKDWGPIRQLELEGVQHFWTWIPAQIDSGVPVHRIEQVLKRVSHGLTNTRNREYSFTALPPILLLEDIEARFAMTWLSKLHLFLMTI